jgi:EAL domain-containing protein (putative c-di-GMP-specific phosphodiesterase class I)
MSVNISSRQFAQPDLVEKFGRILSKVDLKPNSIKLEITETSLIGDLEAALSLLWQLKELGFSLSLDDFGTGYSSLSYLHRFPFDNLKIDKSFISIIKESDKNGAIARTIVSLGHNLGMKVIAEGIENQMQLEELQALQCDYGQGYLFSKPLPSEEATALLHRPKSWLQSATIL